ncbi:1,4-dihydroxy-2-naphthoate octaprenyltransferase [Vibrio zhanjiangensis]|uniref:1,4-dihydroxy-2-naphthoate octaprenyltransferase n=1 Tax=Vibrio zhanjiangensis TaxID=1046128 RepID=A0ABQ6EYM4_9VIBR|nr:1,4-dihydroxy-2-naphthoate polyprenyltransferase [Vibrio zhanjiangensis]GLT17914.1 1,4-dihydroxy-2-naphthoate octaprenyltransferase [Vibrio zhanjiangensis]
MKQSLRIWLDAARPKTLPLALVSILTGSVLAYSTHQASILVTLLAFTTATLLQILSNLANDYGDAVKGTDNSNRLGPMRAIQSGAVTLKDMKSAIKINLAFTLVFGLVLIFYSLDSVKSILIFVALGGLAMIAAVAYTVGNKPYGYVGLGDVSVFIFFGLLGVMGTFFLHTGTITLSLVLPAVGCGLLAVAVLNVNNMRDIENDQECGKRTIAVRLGSRRAKHYHVLLLAGALLSFTSYLIDQPASLWLSLPFLLSALMVYKHGKLVWEARQPVHIAPMMPTIVKCSLITNLLFAGVVIAQTLVS